MLWIGHGDSCVHGWMCYKRKEFVLARQFQTATEATFGAPRDDSNNGIYKGFRDEGGESDDI